MVSFGGALIVLDDRERIVRIGAGDSAAERMRTVPTCSIWIDGLVRAAVSPKQTGQLVSTWMRWHWSECSDSTADCDASWETLACITGAATANASCRRTDRTAAFLFVRLDIMRTMGGRNITYGGQLPQARLLPAAPTP